MIKQQKDANGNVITTVYATKSELSTHAINVNNPHGVTPAQISAEPAFIKNTASIRTLERQMPMWLVGITIILESMNQSLVKAQHLIRI